MFVRDLAERLKLTACATQIAPDQPFLIMTEDPIRLAWRRFLLGARTNFLISNKPSYLHEATLDEFKKKAVANNMFKSPQFSSSLVYGMEYSKLTKKFEPNAFLAPFFCNNIKQTVFADFPTLVEREHQASIMKLDELKHLFAEYVSRLKNNNLMYFDPRLMYF